MTKKIEVTREFRGVGDSATLVHVEKQLTTRHLERAVAPQQVSNPSGQPATGSGQAQQPKSEK